MTQNEKIQPGDIVHLKSGGPRMTVEREISSDKVNGKRFLCKWFKLNDEKEGRYYEYMLESYEEES